MNNTYTDICTPVFIFPFESIKYLTYSFLSIYPSTHLTIYLSSSCVYCVVIFLFESLLPLFLNSFLILMSWNYLCMILDVGLFYSFWLTVHNTFHSEVLNLSSTRKISLLFFIILPPCLCSFLWWMLVFIEWFSVSHTLSPSFFYLHLFGSMFKETPQCFLVAL